MWGRGHWTQRRGRRGRTWGTQGDFPGLSVAQEAVLKELLKKHGRESYILRFLFKANWSLCGAELKTSVVMDQHKVA